VTATPSRFVLRPLLLATLALLAVSATTLWIGVTGARAAASAQITFQRTNSAPQKSGAPTRYTISFQCSAVDGGGETCGAEPTIRIPIELTSSLAETPPLASWAYKADSGIAGLIKAERFENGEYVIELDPDKLKPGDSDTIQFEVTPPNGTTPDGTSWRLKPSFETEAIAPVAVTQPEVEAAEGKASAEAKPVVSKTTLDGGAVYVRGHQVTFNITANCSTSGSTGKLFMTEGALVDQLPAGLEFVKATPEPDVKPAVGSSGEIRWNYPDSESMPEGCAEGSKGPRNYTVVANVPAAGTNQEKVINSATFTGTPIDQAPKSTTAPRELTLIDEAPGSGVEGFLAKSSLAPICVAGADSLPGRTNCFAGTYPGNWIKPISATPGTNPGASEGSYTVNVNYASSRGYETDLVDPVPCLDNETAAGEYTSEAVVGAVEPASVPVCAHPAFNPTALLVSAPSLADALAGGWLPKAILTDGSTISLPRIGGSGYFEIPAADRGKVAAIELPRDPYLTDNHMSMTVFGYSDGSLQGGDNMHDVAYASAYRTGEADPAGTAEEDAKIYIEPTTVQLGIKKSFGGLSTVAGGKAQRTTMTLVGSLAVPEGKVLPGEVILTDLLPEGMTWSNPVTTATFTVVHGLNVSKAVTATIERVANYEEMNRELVRVILPAAAFEEGGEQGGFFTIKSPSNFFVMDVPNETSTFPNAAQIFVKGIGRETPDVCGAGEGTAPAKFESKDELKLIGEEEINYCQAEATLAVQATGGANFSLRKFVQGELDPQRKGAGGIGTTTRAGTGVFSLVWANNGSTPLKEPVIYDILPYVGDTGVDEGQSGNPRDSEFATEFVRVKTPLPAGVAVEYSESTDPCRHEVDASADAGCVDDWSATVPSDPAKVKALKFTSTETYAAGAEPFTLEVEVRLPYGDVNDIAWNSAATNAKTTQGSWLLAAEPPKVGITAPAAKVTPTISTSVSAASSLPGKPVSDQIKVEGTEELNGTVKWKLVGPVTPGAGDSCTAADWSGAPTVDQGQFALAAGADTTTESTPAAEPNAHGCYGYEVTVEGSGFNTVNSPAGTAGEVVLVHPAGPTLSTRVSASSLLPGSSAGDAITIAGTGGYEGTAAWRLAGPVSPVGGSCAAVDWSGAETVAEGEIEVDADGTVSTAATTLTEYGCYGYEVTLEGEHLTTVTSPLGSAGETLLVHPATPTVTTAATPSSGAPGAQASDLVTVSGTGSFAGTVHWKLVGPVATSGGGCEGVDWTGGAVVAEGEFAVAGDGATSTPSTKLDAVGCYGYEVTLEGDHLVTATSPLGSAGETVLIKAPPVPPAPPAPPASGAPDLRIVKRVAEAKVEVGKPLHYTIEVENKGSAPATATVVTDTPGSPLAFVSAESSQGSCGHAFPLTCKVGTVAAGAKVTIKVVAKPLAGGKVLNGATVKSPDESGKKGVKATAASRALIPLKLSKTVREKAVAAGARVHYAITVGNPTAATAHAVRVCDRLPAGLVYVSSSPAAKVSDGSYCWQLATLKGHATKRIAVVARALAGAGGRLVNTAVLSAADAVHRKATAAVRVEARPAREGGVTG